MRDALLFLGGWIGLGILAAVLFSRYKRRTAVRDQLAEARARVGFPPPAPDNFEGTNLADLDECQLILSLPLYSGDDHTTTIEGD
ncbi:hypothetical protein SGFS_065170 [Streptomyces graminofaciens]|uniref:Secreted protein n=1 Tax=Streptomyces graminofaciens TaxID=68212 RepID=A0ABN5VQ23_9ACTN|nr:hypothetical protein [Streptomyces graminofaciens]BBC35223.1 hypothetical protein SGFS_065170 [Streptomyces graminofaciens]